MQTQPAPHPVNSRDWWEDYFETQWDANGGGAQTTHFMQRLLDQLGDAERQFLSSRRLRVLDWGCAHGEGVALLASQFPQSEVTGLDFSRNAIERARRLHGERFIWQERGLIPGMFDVIITSNCLEHFANPVEIARTHVVACRSLYLILVPFEEEPLNPAHLTRFELDSFPEKLEDFRRISAEPVTMDPRYWPGRQLLVTYASPSYLAERSRLLDEAEAARRRSALFPVRDDDGPGRAVAEEFATVAAGLLPSGGRILQAGWGGGPVSLALASLPGIEVTVMDSSRAALDACRERFERARKAVRLVQEDPAAPGPPEFDMVFAAGLQSLVPPEGQAGFVAALASRSRGYVVLLGPNPSCDWYWLWRMEGDFSESPAGKELALADWGPVFRAAGLDYRQTVPVGIRAPEALLEALPGAGPELVRQVAGIHRSPLLPPGQRGLFTAAVGAIPEAGRNAGPAGAAGAVEARLAEMQGALADALAMRLRAEPEIRRLERELAAARHEQKRLEAEAGRLEGLVGTARIERQRIAAGVAEFQRRLQSETAAFRGQRAWQVMLAIRKAYYLIYRKQGGGYFSALKWLAGMLLGKPGGLEEVDLVFPEVQWYLPASVVSEIRPARRLSSAGINQRLIESAPRATKYDVVILPVFEFSFRFQRPQQLALQFARAGHRVFWISPSGPHPVPEGEPYVAAQLNPNLFEIKLGTEIPNIYKSKLTAERVSVISSALREVYRDWAIAESAVIVELPYWRQIAENLGRFGSRLVYDCMDHWETFPELGEFTRSEEAALVRECDVLVVTGEGLRRKHAEKGKRALLVRNGVDFEFFRSKAKERVLGEIARPIVGYCGAIADWFDFALVEEVARSRPGYSFVLVGGRGLEAQYEDPSASRLKQLPNVHFLGHVPHEKVPSYMASFDAATIPFLVNRVTEATDPVKLYEYFSLGKPVVATDMKELAQCGDLVYVATGAREFASALDSALNEPGEEKRGRRIRFAAEASWKKRYEAVDVAIRDSFPRVSVLLVTFNSEEYLRPCMSSLLRNTSYPSFEVVIVDNGSTDGTRRLLEEYVKDPRVRAIYSERNLGFSGGNNLAARQSSGDYLVLLNVDTMVTPGWMERLVRPARWDPTAGVVVAVTNYAGNEARVDFDYSNARQMEEFSQRLAREKMGGELELDVAPLFCALIPRKVWEKVGELDESFEIGMFEDDDYALRVREAGLRVVTAEDCFVHHFGQGAFGRLAPDYYEELFRRNKERFEQKWNRPWMAHRARPGLPLKVKHFVPAEFGWAELADSSGPVRGDAAENPAGSGVLH